VSVCTATKRDGQPCTLPARGEHGLCWAHSPETAEKRKRIASRGGKARAKSRLTALWEEVRGVIANVESGSLEPSQGNTMLRGYGTLISLARLDVEQSELEIQQRRLELDEEERLVLAREMEELRELVEATNDRRGYGA
jgi:hypothetical protein